MSYKKRNTSSSLQKLILPFLLGLGIGSTASYTLLPSTPLPIEHMEAYFSPKGRAATTLIDSIQQAEKTILVQIYSFTSTPIYKALRAAHQRGVQVKIIMDQSQSKMKYSKKNELRKAGIPVWIDKNSGYMHLKTMVIDNKIVLTGSYNYSKRAEYNNVEVLEKHHSPDYAQLCTQHFVQRQAKAKRL